MIRKYKNYIIFGVIAAVLLGVYFVLGTIDNEPKENILPADETITMLDISSDDISEISIKNESGEYTFLYGDDITVKGKEKIDIDKEKISVLRTELSVLIGEMVVSETLANSEKFGIDTPTAGLTITEKNGNKNIFNIGDKTPLENGYYAVREGENKIYILSDNDCNAIMRKLDYYRNTVLFNIVTENVMKIGFEKKDGTKVKFARNIAPEGEKPNNYFSAFNMMIPYEWAAESSEVSKILEPLLTFSISEYVEDNPDDIKKYGFNPYSAKITIEQNNGDNYSILTGDSVNGKIYIKLENKPGIYLSDATVFSFLDVEPFAYIQRFAYIKNIDTVKKIVYNHNGITKAEFDIKKVKEEEHDIRKDGKNVSQTEFKKMYTELVSMTVAGEISYAPSGKPILTYEFYYIDGTKGTVSYYEYDDRKIALSVDGKIQFFVNKTEFNSRVSAINEIINKF